MMYMIQILHSYIFTILYKLFSPMDCYVLDLIFKFKHIKTDGLWKVMEEKWQSINPGNFTKRLSMTVSYFMPLNVTKCVLV